MGEKPISLLLALPLLRCTINTSVHDKRRQLYLSGSSFLNKIDTPFCTL